MRHIDSGEYIEEGYNKSRPRRTSEETLEPQAISLLTLPSSVNSQRSNFSVTMGRIFNIFCAAFISIGIVSFGPAVAMLFLLK